MNNTGLTTYVLRGESRVIFIKLPAILRTVIKMRLRFWSVVFGNVLMKGRNWCNNLLNLQYVMW